MTAGPAPQRDGIKISITVKNGSDEFTMTDYISPLEILQCSGEKELEQKLRSAAHKMISGIIENHYEDD